MKCKNCQKEINEEFQLCKFINSGSYSQIYSLCNFEDKKYIAKKLYDDDPELQVCDKLKNIKNVNLAKYITTKIDKSDNRKIIIYEYIHGNSLQDTIYQKIDKNKFIRIIRNLVKQLLELENQNYYFLDINKSNVIVNDEKVSLIDYGTLSSVDKFIKKGDKVVATHREYFGTYGFVPPEFIVDKNICPSKFDVFSIGIILFEYFYNFNPLSMTNYYFSECWYWCNKDCLHNREKCLVKFMDKYRIQIDDSCKYIILKCLEFDINKRISLDKLHDLLNFTCCDFY